MEAARSAGVSAPVVDWKSVAEYRDYMIRNLDDSKQVAGYEQLGVTVVKRNEQPAVFGNKLATMSSSLIRLGRTGPALRLWPPLCLEGLTVLNHHSSSRSGQPVRNLNTILPRGTCAGDCRLRLRITSY